MAAMDSLFVYDWTYKGQGIIFGQCLDDKGAYRQLKLHGYYPFCYVDGEALPSSNVVPVRSVYKQMYTSLDISTSKPFHQVFFRSVKDMRTFCNEHRYRCYMDDISQTTMFLCANGLDHIGWINVPAFGTSFNIRDIVPVPARDPCATPTIMAFDIEVRSSDLTMPKAHRLFDEIEMISVIVKRGDESTVFLLHKAIGGRLDLDCHNEVWCKNECELIDSFFGLIRTEDPDIITGYNIYGFDLDYIICRQQLWLRDIPDLSRASQGVEVRRIEWASNAYGSNNYNRLIIHGRLILDMFLYFKRMKLDKYSLEFVSNKFLGEGKQTGMGFIKLNKALHSHDPGELREVAAYCVRDSELVIRLFDKVGMWIDVCEVAKITRCSIEEIYTRGEQMKVISQCVKECMDRNIVLKPQPKASVWRAYEGAHVIEPIKGLYKHCALLDFQSLYPSIIIAFNICPSTYTTDPTIPPIVGFLSAHRFRTNTVGMFPGMIKRLLQERKHVKTLMSACDPTSMEHAVLHRRQNALKICANSVYGIMGFKNSRYFGHVGCAESVTAIGRMYLSKVINEIEQNAELKVIYGDTDSCMVYNTHGITEKDMINTANTICDDITLHKLPKPMVLSFESYYDSVVLLSKKRYIMLRGDKVYYKGVVSARRDYCYFAKQMFNDMVYMVARGDNDIGTAKRVVEYIDDKLQQLISGVVNLSELTVTKSVRELGSYKVNQPHVMMAKRLVQKGIEVPPGSRLEYVFVKGEGKQGDKMMTPDEVRDNGLQIDPFFYIEKQLITQIDDVLEVIGINGYIKNRYIVNC